MNKWDKYKVTDSPAPSNKWDKYKVVPKVQKEEDQGDSWPALIGKSALKGVSSLADIPKLAATVGEGTVNLGRKSKGSPIEQYWAGTQGANEFAKSKIKIDNNAPQTNYSDYIPSTEGVRKSVKTNTGIDLEPKPTSPAQRIAAHGIEFGTSMTPIGLAAKNTNLFSKFKNAADMTKGATAVGLGSGALQEAGMNPLVADLTSSVVTPTNIGTTVKNTANKLKNVPNRLKTIPLSMAGVGPKRLKVDVANAAKDLGIELPLAVVTDHTGTHLAENLISKAPFLGDIVKRKYGRTQEQIHDVLNKIYDEIGPERTPEVSEKIRKLYEIASSSLPSDAVIKPTNTVDKLNRIKVDSYIPSPNQTKLLNYTDNLKNSLNPSINSLNPTIKGSKGDVKVSLPDELITKLINSGKIPLSEAPVKNLIGSKISINDIVDHDIRGGSIDQLMNVHKGLTGDIEEYGKKNPTWFKDFKKAENYFARVAKREKMEKIFREQGTSDVDNISYSMLSKSINKRKGDKLIKKHAPEETYEKIKKLGIVTRALVDKNKHNPNPSGTAGTKTILTFLTSLYLDPTGTTQTIGGAGVVGGLAATNLLTDQKFLDMALKFAEEQGKKQTKDQLARSMQLNKRAKEITGYSLNSLYKASQKQMNTEEN